MKLALIVSTIRKASRRLTNAKWKGRPLYRPFVVFMNFNEAELRQ